MSPLDRIAAEAEALDGSSPLDEATWRALRHHPERTRTWLEDDGFAVLVDDELSLAVRPDARGRGLGRELLSRVLGELAPSEQGLLAWSHGNHPAAAALAAAYDFRPVRDLWVMRRATSLPLPEVSAPEGVEIRGFEPGDEGGIVRVNAAAFAAHPEQGAMDAADLAERMSEAWFRPEDLLVADSGTGLLGFHWTKQHSLELGEVYVVGVDPAAQGAGLGKRLTLAGLHHLASRGVRDVLLYVESDNLTAVAVYAGLGFSHAPADTHVQYRRTPALRSGAEAR